MLKKLAIVGICILVLIGCSIFDDTEDSDGSNGLNNEETIISTQFVNELGINANLGRVINVGIDQEDIISGLYFGELEVVAYQYSPGFSDAGGFGKTGSIDWAYNVILQSGHPTARDIVLESNQVVDINEMNGDYATALDESFIDEYDYFSIDFLEVHMSGIGLIMDDKFYGTDTNGVADDHPLYKYSHLSDLPTSGFMSSEIEDIPVNVSTTNPSVFLVRSDWFPEAVAVNIDAYEETATINWSDKTITDFQKELIESLVENGTNRRSYLELFFIPYGEAIPTSISTEVVEEDGTIINTIEQPMAILSFDFSNMLSDICLTDYQDDDVFNNSNTVDGHLDPNKRLIFRLEDSIPLGLSVTIETE
ncbi:MAG: hypothetical protein OCD02_23985 [Spirochaetaceae bacterium]